VKHETQSVPKASAPVDSGERKATTYQVFASAVTAAICAKPGTGTEAAALSFARRMAHEVYLEDCRSAAAVREKWLALLAIPVSGIKTDEGSRR
jgi:hypothetical protein